jgi:Ser-tRNA(Ala) deacylase AlaX
MNLTSLELKYSKSLETTSTNTNTINNFYVSPDADLKKLKSGTDAEPKKSDSSQSIRSESPINIKQFKEALILILISYFKNNVVLLNNLVELSDKIITKIDDLRLLVSLLIEESPAAVNIEIEEIDVKNCCGMICKNLPRYRKIKQIIINNKQNFQVSHNQFFTQMGTEFNISLEYVLP